MIYIKSDRSCFQVFRRVLAKWYSSRYLERVSERVRVRGSEDVQLTGHLSYKFQLAAFTLQKVCHTVRSALTEQVFVGATPQDEHDVALNLCGLDNGEHGSGKGLAALRISIDKILLSECVTIRIETQKRIRDQLGEAFRVTR